MLVLNGEYLAHFLSFQRSSHTNTWIGSVWTLPRHVTRVFSSNSSQCSVSVWRLKYFAKNYTDRARTTRRQQCTWIENNKVLSLLAANNMPIFRCSFIVLAHFRLFLRFEVIQWIRQLSFLCLLKLSLMLKVSSLKDGCSCTSMQCNASK